MAKSVFVFCDLENTSFESSDVEGVIFEKCNLTNTVFVGAKMNGVGFKNCKISETILDINGFVNFGESQGFKLL